MKLLLDTHAFLWFIAGDPKLSKKAKSNIENEKNENLISIASLWEIAIKTSIGRLTVSEPFETLIPRQIEINGFQILTINFKHIAKVASLPYHHRDPFDRLLISQCIIENYPIISKDTVFDNYRIDRYW